MIRMLSLVALRTAAVATRLLRDRRGATAIEYGLILALLVLVMLVAFANVAESTNRMWKRVNNEVEAAR